MMGYVECQGGRSQRHQPLWTEHHGWYYAAGAEGRWNFDATLAGQVGNLTGKAGWGLEAELEC